MCFLTTVSAHTIVSKPVSRQYQVHTNANTANGGECGTSQTITATYTRGEIIDFQWGRNNHYTGFTQVSVLKLADVQGDGKNQLEAFDNPSNIIHVSCYNQLSCPAGRADTSMPVFGLGPDLTDFQQLMCNTKLTIPTYLEDGDYVMKTIIFGNGDSFGVRNMPHSSYSNCHNFKVSGGPSVAKPSGNAHIDFQLNDDAIRIINQKNNMNVAQGQCVFLATNTHMGCIPAGQRSPICTGKVAEISRCGNSETADNRATCIGPRNNDGAAQGGDLYNYMIGRPPYHPNYDGKFQIIRHTGDILRSIDIGGSPIIPGNTETPGGESCTPNGQDGSNCINKPECCTIPGQICYEKDKFYAACLTINSCVPGIHADDPPQFLTPWSCTPLGLPVPVGGAFGIFWIKYANRVFDVSGAENKNGANVWMWENFGPGVSQKWEMADDQIRWVGTDKCLDIASNNIVIWTCDAKSETQKWVWISLDRIARKSMTEKCLEVTDGDCKLGANLKLGDCDVINPDQKFEKRPLLSTSDGTSAPHTATTNTLKWPTDGTPVVKVMNDGTTLKTNMLVVPMKSTVVFTGASRENPVTKVCAELFETGAEPGLEMMNPCGTTELSTLQVVGDQATFTADEAGEYYFIGTDFKFDKPESQKVKVIVSNFFSNQDAADCDVVDVDDMDDNSSSFTIKFAMYTWLLGLLIVQYVV